jgi:hypothetical protein
MIPFGHRRDDDAPTFGLLPDAGRPFRGQPLSATQSIIIISMINLTGSSLLHLLEEYQASIDMTTLGERMRSSGEPTEYWPLQVLLDTYAAAQSVPLRCLNVGRLRALHRRDDAFSAKIREHFPSEAAFHAEIADVARDTGDGLIRLREHEKAWREILGDDVFHYWIVLPSHSSPLAVLLRESRSWAWWETIWCIRQGLTVAAGGTAAAERLRAPLTYGGPLGRHVHLADLHVPALDVIVFAGPVWTPWPLGASEGHRVRDAESAVLAFLSSAGGIVRQELRDSISTDRLLRHVRHRAPVAPGDLRLRLRQIGDALDHALATEVEDELPAVHVEALAASTLFQRCRRAAARPPRQPRRWSVLYPLPGLDRDPDDSRPVLERWHRSDWRVEDHGWRLAGTRLTGAVEPAPGDTVLLGTGSTSAGDTAGQAPQDPALSRFLNDSTTNRNSYLLERLSLMRLWLQSTYLELSTEAKPKEVGDAIGRLARRLVQMLGADGCSFYRYDAEQRTLERFACYFTYDTSEALDDTADLVRDAGRDPATRARSASYQAIDDPGRDLVFHRSVRDAPIPLADPRHVPRCVLAVPILVHDRPWGVMEIKALHPYQVSEASVRWAKEAVRLVGPYFYERWLLENMHDIDKIAVGKNEPREKLRSILRHFARVFVASSGALYLTYARRTSEYECVAHFGRPGVEPEGTLDGFDGRNPDSVSAKLLLERKDDWLAGRVGEPPFDGAWLEKPKTQALLTNGHRYIAVIAIRDSRDFPFGTITLTSREHYPFSDLLRNHVHYMARHVGVHIEGVQSQQNDEYERQEYLAHSVKNRVDRVLGSVERVEQRLARFFGAAGDADRLVAFLDGVEILASRTRHNLARISAGADQVVPGLRALFDRQQSWSFDRLLEDLRLHTAELRNSAVYLSGGPNVENPWEADPDRWEGTWARLRECLATAVKPREVVLGRPAIIVPPRQELELSLKVRTPSVVLVEIIANIVDNAIKYNFDQDQPQAHFFSSERGAFLEIKNLAPPPGEHEEAQLGERGFRAAYARERNSDGTGRGLAMSKAVAKRWGLDLQYTRQVPDRRGELIWHRVRLVFPPGSFRRGSL